MGAAADPPTRRSKYASPEFEPIDAPDDPQSRDGDGGDDGGGVAGRGAGGGAAGLPNNRVYSPGPAGGGAGWGGGGVNPDHAEPKVDSLGGGLGGGNGAGGGETGPAKMSEVGAGAAG